MNISKALKFGNPIYLPQLEEAYALAANGKVEEHFLSEFTKLIEYARYCPNKNYRYEIGSLVSQYYSNFSALFDPTFIAMHKVLFGAITADVNDDKLTKKPKKKPIKKEYNSEAEKRQDLINQLSHS